MKNFETGFGSISRPEDQTRRPDDLKKGIQVSVHFQVSGWEQSKNTLENKNVDETSVVI